VKVTILGCGTSGGVPRIGGVWGKCDPKNPKNRRRRVSILVEQGGTQVMVDTSPDFREQCLDAGIARLDGVLFTHDHADHTHGIDDLRGIFLTMRRRVDIWADHRSLGTLQHRFPYIFESADGYPAICTAHIIDGYAPLRIGAIEARPFPQEHGAIISFGFRFGDLAYSTDLVGLPEQSWQVLQGVKIWIVDALQPEPHPTHAHLDMTLGWIARLKPERAILTHMNWNMDYETLRRELPLGVEPAYDGMVIEI
jgi:phosphoribosyl 1,2-cyclic phosphate phosphodiesterase